MRLLIAEDDPALGNFLARGMEQEGHTVTMATDGTMAIRTPALEGRVRDIETLTAHFLERMGKTSPAKQITAPALARLVSHCWPGNVRELEHVLERAWILAEDRPRIDREEIELDETE